jgi:hypothetical protein
MALNEDKLRSLLESYNVQQRECGDLQVQVDQKEADIHLLDVKKKRLLSLKIQKILKKK